MGSIPSALTKLNTPLLGYFYYKEDNLIKELVAEFIIQGPYNMEGYALGTMIWLTYLV